MARGLETLRALVQQEKQLNNQYTELNLFSNLLLLSKPQMIREMAELYFVVPSMIQSLDIIRWLGKFRNDGRYNNDTYLKQIQLLEKLTEK